MFRGHLKIGLEYALDQFESESGEGPWTQSSSRGCEGEGRPGGEDLEKAPGEALKKIWARRPPVKWVIIGTTGTNALFWLNEQHQLPLRNPFSSQSHTESWQPGLERLFSISSLLGLPPQWAKATQAHSLPPFKNIINILSRKGCAHSLQIDASCLVSSHACFGIICQTMLWVPFPLN